MPRVEAAAEQVLKPSIMRAATKLRALSASVTCKFRLHQPQEDARFIPDGHPRWFPFRPNPGPIRLPSQRERPEEQGRARAHHRGWAGTGGGHLLHPELPGGAGADRERVRRQESGLGGSLSTRGVFHFAASWSPWVLRRF